MYSEKLTGLIFNRCYLLPVPLEDLAGTDNNLATHLSFIQEQVKIIPGYHTSIKETRISQDGN